VYISGVHKQSSKSKTIKLGSAFITSAECETDDISLFDLEIIDVLFDLTIFISFETRIRDIDCFVKELAGIAKKDKTQAFLNMIN